MATSSLADLLAAYQPMTETESTDLRQAGKLLSADHPWHRDIPLHFTASALIVHPETRRTLLRWHERQQAWLQVGGHADPGESDPLAIALRESEEETGLADLVPWPDAALLHLAVVPVPASPKEPAHHHVDLRFLLATRTPDAARPERPSAALRWLSLPAAREATTEENLRESLDRAGHLLTSGQDTGR